MSTPGDQLQRERQRRGLSQGELARHLGVSASAISRWERGKDVPGPYQQQRLHTFLEQDAQPQEKPQTGATTANGKSEKQQEGRKEENSAPVSPPSTPARKLPPLFNSGELPAWYPSFQRDRRFILVFLVVLLVVLVVSGIAIEPVFTQGRAQGSPSLPRGSHAIVGQLSFLSSGQVRDNSSQGISDIVRLRLQLPYGPSPGKQYYAWLLPDAGNAEAQTLLLGTTTKQGQIGVVTYSDPEHTNLLASMSRLLVTEQDASVTPLSPSTDHRDWRYIASIPQIRPSATAYSPYSLLDHIRHLLARETTLEGHGLHGGLVIWLEHNTGRLVEWSTGARDDWQSGSNAALSQMRQQLTRVLITLDGISSAPIELPANAPYKGLVDPPMANVGLLPLDSQQDAFSLVTDVDFHLQGVAASPGVTTNQQQESATILAVMDRINAWLRQVRDDDRRLLRMSDQQLRQPGALSLLNDLQLNAVSAFSGQIDQATGARQEGVQWVFHETQNLAEMAVTPAS